MSQVSIQPVGAPDKRLVLEQLGDDEVAGGDAMWTVLERDGRTPMTTWEGTTATTWVLPLSLDSFEATTERSVERAIATLDSWRTPTEQTDKPPVLVVDAPLGRARATARWVITSLEWGDQVRNAAGQRTRQDVRVTLLEYEPGTIKKGPAAKSRDNAKKHKWVPKSAKDRSCKTCGRPRDDKRHNNR